MPDYTLDAFQGWREDGDLHLPDSNSYTTLGHTPRGQLQASEICQPPPKPKKSREGVSRPSAKGQTNERMVFPLASKLGLTATTLPSQIPDKKWISRSKRGLPHFHAGHSTNALSGEVNTILCEEVEDLHLSAYKFTLFPQLPPELRLKVWLFAIPRQRLVELKPDTVIQNWAALGFLGLVDPDTNIHSVRSPTPVPSMLHTCVESRTEMLKYYKCTFGGRRWRGREPQVYFDASVDILFLNCHGFQRFSFMDLLLVFEKHGVVSGVDNVSTLAICTGMAEALASHNRRKDNHHLIDMPVLKRLVCVSHGNHSLKSDILVPTRDAQPTRLKHEDIEAVENLFGVEVELSCTQGLNCEVSTTLCLLLELLLLNY